MNVVIGSAQFGMDYGVTNKTGLTPNDEIAKILSYCKDKKINFIDTASDYGDAEQKLGANDLNSFYVSSKLKLDHKYISYKRFKNNIIKSLDNLNIRSLYCLLIHNPNELDEDNFLLYKEFFLKAKSEGLINNIGISIYEPEILRRLDFDWVDLFQAPFNLFDNRLFSSGLLKKFKKAKKIIQVRSIFLQGVLLSDFNKLPNYFRRFKNEFAYLDLFCEENSISRLEASIYFLRLFSDIDQVIIGVESLKQLKEINSVLESDYDGLNKFEVFIKDRSTDLIDPRNWDLPS